MQRQEAGASVDTFGVEAESLDPGSAEKILRERLQGHRMVFELGLDEDEFRRFRRPLFVALRRQTVEMVARQFPALLATYMTYAGVLLYQGGDYWGSLHPSLKEPEAEAGRHFMDAVGALGLERFDRIVTEERAWRWVSRILAQGGIPRSCLAPFADLVVREVEAGAPDGAALLATWRTRGASLTQLHVPTRRFLLYGGEEAADLVDRCIELVRDGAGLGKQPTAADAGLPQYVVDAFAAVATVQRTARQRVGESVPRPQIRLEPYDGLGAVVALPRVASDQLGGVWRVEAGGQVHRHEPSSYASDTVRLPPAQSVEAEFLTAEGIRRRWSFELLGSRAVAFFDPATQQLMRVSGALSASEVWLLCAAGVNIGARFADGVRPPREIQALPPPSGWWNGFVLHHLDLDNVRELVLDDGREATVRILVAPPRARPALRGPSLDSVTAQGDLPVFSATPYIEVPRDETTSWSVQLAGPNGQRSGVFRADENGRIELSRLLAGTPFGSYRVRVRGPIGSDLAARFALIPGLRVRRPAGVLMPESRSPEVEIEADAVRGGEGDAFGQPYVLELADEAADVATAKLTHESGRSLDLAVGVPRLLWSVVHDTKPAVNAASRVIRVDAEEFDDHLADRLLVSVGRPGIDMTLELVDRDGQPMVALPRITTVGASGRWAFDLGPFADTIRSAGGARLMVRLVIGVRHVHVADVVGGTAVSAVTAHADGEILRVGFKAPRAVSARVVRLWSVTQAWMEPIQCQVPDGETEITFPVGKGVSPGPYLAEVAIEDPWVVAARPAPRESNVRPVQIGDRERFVEWMEQLDAEDPLTLVTLVLGRHYRQTSFPIERLVDVAGELAAGFSSLLDETAIGQSSEGRFERLANVAGARDAILAAVLVRAGEESADADWVDRLDLRLSVLTDPKSDELDPHVLNALWRVCPVVASILDLPWAVMEESARDRCRLHLGWEPGEEAPAVTGGRVSQLELHTPPEQLRDLRFTLGLKPVGLLDPQVRMLGTFDWLLAHHAAPSEDKSLPQQWYGRHEALRDLDALALPTELRALLDEHLQARTPPYGTEAWAALPAVLLAAAARHRWAEGSSQQLGLGALEEALPWGRRLVRSDGALLTALEVQAGVR